VAGALFGHFRQFLHTNDFQFIRSIEIIIMIVLGGMGSITGSVLGAIVITILPELLPQVPGDLYGYRLVILFALLILIMLTRPQGVWGSKEFGIPWLKRAQRPAGGRQTSPVRKVYRSLSKGHLHLWTRRKRLKTGEQRGENARNYSR